MKARLRLLTILTALLIMPGYAHTAEDSAMKFFVQQLVNAVNRDNDEARANLMHPDALVCARKMRQVMAEAAYAPRKKKIPPDYRWNISEMPAGSAGWFPDKFDYPVRPTHQLQIDFDTTPRKSESMVVQLVRYGNEWREVSGCPKPGTIIEAKQAAKDRGKQETHIKELAASIDPALKTELSRLLADGRKVAAILRYRDATHEELAVAKGVIEQLTLESEAHNGK